MKKKVEMSNINQSKKLLGLLRYVQQYVPFYRTALNGVAIETEADAVAAFHRLPIMTKEAMMENYNEMFSCKVDPTDLLWEHTSGTTGIALRIGKSHKERTTMALELMKWRKAHFGIEFNEMYGYFTTIPQGEKYKFDRNVLFMSEINLDDDSLELYYELMVSSQIKWMFSTPAVTYVLMNYMKKNKKAPITSLRYIELTGEQILKDEKEVLSTFFGCTVAEQYGIREIWAIAKECKNGNLHVFEDQLIMEIQHKKMYVTSLELFSMPIIRYQVDDIIEYGSTCDCGCNKPTIRILQSRALLFLYVGREFPISPILLRICITKLIYEYKFPIEQYRFEQYDYNGVTCYIKCNGSVSESNVAVLLKTMLVELYPLPSWFEITVKKVDSLMEYMKRGKLGYFVSYI